MPRSSRRFRVRLAIRFASISRSTGTRHGRRYGGPAGVDRPGRAGGAAARAAEVGRADRVLWVVDVREPRTMLSQPRVNVVGARPMTLVRNKIDLVSAGARGRRAMGTRRAVVSALTGAGSSCSSSTFARLAGASGEVAGTFSARRRHLDALDARRRPPSGGPRASSTAPSSSLPSSCAARSRR